MIKKFICFLWGHKTVHKAYTGKTVDVVGAMGNEYTIALYKYQRTDFCTRCGKKSRREVMIVKFLNRIMDIEFLAKWLLAWGIGVNVLIVAWILGKVITAIASL